MLLSLSVSVSSHAGLESTINRNAPLTSSMHGIASHAFCSYT